MQGPGLMSRAQYVDGFFQAARPDSSSTTATTVPLHARRCCGPGDMGPQDVPGIQKWPLRFADPGCASTKRAFGSTAACIAPGPACACKRTSTPSAGAMRPLSAGRFCVGQRWRFSTGLPPSSTATSDANFSAASSHALVGNCSSSSSRSAPALLADPVARFMWSMVHAQLRESVEHAG